MPTGVLLVAERAVTVAGQIKPTPQYILDVGCGYGKYGVLLREYLDPTPQIHGIELWEPYVEPHRLRGIYDHLRVGDALLLPQPVLDNFDMVMMGDVIEHMPKEDALAFLGRVKGSQVIVTPVVYFQAGNDSLPPTECHVSHWTRQDFEDTGRLEHYEESYGAIVARLGPLR